jgi:hypothetical protein
MFQDNMLILIEAILEKMYSVFMNLWLKQHMQFLHNQ